MDQLVKDDTVLLCFHQNYKNFAAESYVNNGSVDGLNILLFEDESEFGHSHAGMRKSLTENNVINYLTGTGELPDNYIIRYYDPEKYNNPDYADSIDDGYPGFVRVNTSEVKTLDDVYEFFGLER